MRLALLAGLAALISSAASAEVALVRSGEHPGYTRVVIELAARSDWRLGRLGEGYGFDPGREGVSYNLRDVFRLIGRDRLADIREDDTGRLLLDLACDCHATAVDFSPSWVVIDISDGPAPAGAGFEADLDTPASNPDRSEGARWVTAPTWGLGDAADGSYMPQAETAAAEMPPNLEETSPEETAVSDPTAATLATGYDPAAWQKQWVPDIPLPEASAEADDAVAVGRESVSEQEERLLRELSRAAAQGLLEANLPDLDAAGEIAAMEAAPAPAPTEAPDAEDHIRMEAETSIDRDSGHPGSEAKATPDGQRCLPDAEFAFDTWGEEGDLAAQLTERRAALVGEFDRPDPDAVLALARFYLYLGFGAEAKATIAAFGANLTEGETVILLADLIDGERSALPGALAGQMACDGPVALWSVLAEGGPGTQDTNLPAIFAAFSALPVDLRRHLGPGLAEGFLTIGDAASALTIRNAIARSPGPHGAGLGYLDAQIALAEDDPEAPRALEALMQEDDSIAPEAYVTFLRAELDAGRVPEHAPETAASLAFELAGTETGAELAELAVRAVIASGDFEEARREALRLEEAGAGYDPALWRTYAGGLVLSAQDGEFLRQAFAARDPLGRAELPPETAVAIAERLTGLGFPDEALRYLGEDDAGEPSLIARANALLASGRPSEAFGAIASLNGTAVDRLRARALLDLGDARGAAERFLAAGDTVSAERAAWIAGAWDLLQSGEPDSIQAYALAQVETTIPEVGNLDAPSTLAGPANGASGVGTASEQDAPDEPFVDATDETSQVGRARAALAEATAARELMTALVAGN